MSRSTGRAAIWLLVLLGLIIVVAAASSLLLLRAPAGGGPPLSGSSAPPPWAAGAPPRESPGDDRRRGSAPTALAGEGGPTAEDRVRVGQAGGGAEGPGPTAGEPAPTTRFFELPPPSEAILPSEVVDAALHAPTVGERSNAATWLGRQGDLPQLAVLEKMQISDPNPQVRKAAARAADDLRRRFSGQPWPSVPPGNPSKYLNK